MLPLVAADPSVSLATILAGMRELLGARPPAGAQRDADAVGGCGGECGCGADEEAGPVLDVRAIPTRSGMPPSSGRWARYPRAGHSCWLPRTTPSRCSRSSRTGSGAHTDPDAAATLDRLC